MCLFHRLLFTWIIRRRFVINHHVILIIVREEILEITARGEKFIFEANLAQMSSINTRI